MPCCSAVHRHEAGIQDAEHHVARHIQAGDPARLRARVLVNRKGLPDKIDHQGYVRAERGGVGWVLIRLQTDAPTLMQHDGKEVQGPAAGEEDVEERRNAPAIVEAALSEQVLIF